MRSLFPLFNESHHCLSDNLAFFNHSFQKKIKNTEYNYNLFFRMCKVFCFFLRVTAFGQKNQPKYKTPLVFDLLIENMSSDLNTRQTFDGSSEIDTVPDIRLSLHCCICCRIAGRRGTVFRKC